MADWIGTIPFGDLSGWGIVAITVLALIRGWLRPSSVVKEIREDRDARVAEARERYIEALQLSEMYRKSAQEQADARKDQAKILQDMMTTVRLMEDRWRKETEEG